MTRETKDKDRVANTLADIGALWFLVGSAIFFGTMAANGQTTTPLPGTAPQSASIYSIQTSPGPVISSVTGEKVKVDIAVTLTDGTTTRNLLGLPLSVRVTQQNGTPEFTCEAVPASCTVKAATPGTVYVDVTSPGGEFGYSRTHVIVEPGYNLNERRALIFVPDAAQTSDWQINGLSVVFPRTLVGQYNFTLRSTRDPRRSWGMMLPNVVPAGRKMRVSFAYGLPLTDPGETFCGEVQDIQTGELVSTGCGEMRGKYGWRPLKAEFTSQGDLRVVFAASLVGSSRYKVVLTRGDHFYLQFTSPIIYPNADGTTELLVLNGSLGYEAVLQRGLYTVTLVGEEDPGLTWAHSMPDALEVPNFQIIR